MTGTNAAPVARPSIAYDMTVLDTDDIDGLSEFYAALLGWRVTDQSEDWVAIRGEPGQALGFQLAPDHRPPTWPDEAVPQQVHLDLTVTDPDAAAAYAESLGARKMPRLPDQPDSFTVFVDPSGHPFCLCVAD